MGLRSFWRHCNSILDRRLYFIWYHRFFQELFNRIVGIWRSISFGPSKQSSSWWCWNIWHPRYSNILRRGFHWSTCIFSTRGWCDMCQHVVKHTGFLFLQFSFLACRTNYVRALCGCNVKDTSKFLTRKNTFAFNTLKRLPFARFKTLGLPWLGANEIREVGLCPWWIY